LPQLFISLAHCWVRPSILVTYSELVNQTGLIIDQNLTEKKVGKKSQEIVAFT